MGSMGNSNEVILYREGNFINYPGPGDVSDLYGTLSYHLYRGTMRPLGDKNGVEYGIVGSKKTTNSHYNSNIGHIGYKIDNGIISITHFSPTTVANATKWTKEALREDYDWIKIGRIK